jgi:hypothetical protein
VWEIISAITGTISALCDIRAAGTTETANQKPPTSPSVLPPNKGHAFLVRTAAWCLGCASFLWITQPYGVFISDRERTEIMGWFLAGPAFLILLASLEPAGTVTRTTDSSRRTSKARTR